MVRWVPILASGAVLLCTATSVHAQSLFAAAASIPQDGVLTGMFLGLLVFSLIYNAAFYVLFRERFLIWQSIRTAVYFAMAIGLLPYMIEPFQSPDSFTRQLWLTVCFDLGVAVSGPFLRTYLEPGTIPKRLIPLLGWPPFLILLTTPVTVMTDPPALYFAVRHLLLVAMLAIATVVVVIALRRGSRTARYQLAAWSGIGGIYAVSLIHDAVLGTPFEALLYLLFPALGLEVMLTALGILDRLLRLRDERQEAQALAEAMRVMANTDPLTGLPNRRALEEAYNRETPAAIALVDVDHFKSINDNYGHDVGDQVICAAGAALNSGSAMAARVGGEEFALLFHAPAGNVAAEAERLRQSIGAHVARMVPTLKHPVTASMGFVHIAPGTDFSAAMKSADINLYTAKESGRNRTVFIQAA